MSTWTCPKTKQYGCYPDDPNRGLIAERRCRRRERDIGDMTTMSGAIMVGCEQRVSQLTYDAAKIAKYGRYMDRIGLVKCSPGTIIECATKRMEHEVDPWWHRQLSGLIEMAEAELRGESAGRDNPESMVK